MVFLQWNLSFIYSLVGSNIPLAQWKVKIKFGMEKREKLFSTSNPLLYIPWLNTYSMLLLKIKCSRANIDGYSNSNIRWYSFLLFTESNQVHLYTQTFNTKRFHCRDENEKEEENLYTNWVYSIDLKITV